MTKLRDIAHARAGDKGNRSNICVFVYDDADYDLLLREITPERLKATFPELLKGEIKRYELPNLGGINLVMDQALEGGVNLSLNLDGHGKSWSFLVLDLEVGH
jgi:hypothetical protein